jgi:hypothetical protein
MLAGAAKGDDAPELGGWTGEGHSRAPNADRREELAALEARCPCDLAATGYWRPPPCARQGRGAGTVNFRPIAPARPGCCEQGCWRRGIVNVTRCAVVRMIGGPPERLATAAARPSRTPPV